MVAGRGRLMQDQPGGAMLAVMLEPHAVQPLLDPGTSLAAINAPAQVVVSGPATSIARLEKRLVADEVEVHRLPIGLAAHSPMMDAIAGQFRELVSDAVRRPARAADRQHRDGRLGERRPDGRPRVLGDAPSADGPVRGRRRPCSSISRT